MLGEMKREKAGRKKRGEEFDSRLSESEEKRGRFTDSVKRIRGLDSTLLPGGLLTFGVCFWLRCQWDKGA